MHSELVLASTNPAKTSRLAELCEGLGLFLIEGQMINPLPVVPETGETHLAIAIEKATAWSKATNGLALASDGGLVIPALGDGWESTLTRRGTGEDVADVERARRLLSRMRDLAGERRAAHWAEGLALARDGKLVAAWEADGQNGFIGEEYVADSGGPDGFWADALWETTDGRKRWQLSEAERMESDDPWAQLRGPLRDVLTKLP